MKLSYRPKGVCSQRMDVEIENGVITKAVITGGCDGNSKGVASLVTGMRAEDAIARMEGIRCGRKATSCPDQLSKALRECLSTGNDGE